MRVICRLERDDVRLSELVRSRLACSSRSGLEEC